MKTKYYIIEDDIIYRANDNYAKRVKNCLYIRKCGLNITIYSEKKNNKWVIINYRIRKINSLLDLIAQNNQNIICLKNFEGTDILKLVERLKKDKNINITFVTMIGQILSTNWFNSKREETLDKLKTLRKELTEKYGSEKEKSLKEYKIKRHYIINRAKILSRIQMAKIYYKMQNKNT